MPSVNEFNEIGAPEQLPGAEDVFVFPASFAQQRLWFLDKLEPGQNTYNVPFALRLNGNLNQQALERTLQEIVNRHEVLRTTFSEDESGKPIQLVAPERKFRLEVSDLRTFPLQSREEEARRHVIEHVRLPFDLKCGPLFRANLFRLADAEWILSLAFHHIIVDGWSWGVVLQELATLYEAFSQGKDSPLAPLSIQYGDYATWQQDWLQGERLQELISFWKKQLSDAPPVLELPADFSRPLMQTFAGAQESTMVPRSLQDALTELSQKEGVTLFMTLLSAFDLLLARYSGQNDIVVGTPISGRTRSELEGLIGFLVNTLPLRTDVSGNPTFREFLARVRETALQAYAHQELPFERLVEELSPERDLSRSPVIQVLYIFENSIAKQKSHIGDLELLPFRGAEGTTAKFDMQFSALVNPSGLRLALTYNVDLFQTTTVQRMLAHLQTILQAMVANPESRIADLCLLDDAERQQLLVDFNNTHNEYRRDVLVHQLVEDQVERNAGAVAVSYNDEQLTYAELNERSNRLANYLRSTGIAPGALVAICMERSIEMVVSVLATLKSGAAYVPLDPEYPKDRLAFMLEDSEAAVVLTQERIRSELEFGSTRVLCVDSAWGDISRHKAENPKNLATPEDLVYVIYTSGSTGKPKGVCLPHRCLSNLLYWQLETSQAAVGDRTLQFTSLSFDVSFQEIFSTLSSGGSLVLISESTRRDGRALLQYLKQHRVVRLFQPFVALQQIAEAASEERDLPTSLREVITAGEQLKITQQIASFFQRLPGCKLFNHYGPSETHVVTSYELSGSPGSWETLPPIGKPVANTQIYILDSNRNPVPLGVSGELYIGGVSLAKGYLRRPDLTNERFVQSPFSTNSDDLLYRTGDLCRYLPDGNIQYLGRIDNQVKFRGYRIELGEIESALAKHAAVQQSAVILREDVPGDKRLVAYVVARNGAINSTELRSHLKQTLPEYMVPSAFVQMETLPLTPSGKVSRRQLPVPEWDNTPSEAAAPRNPIEELLLGIWSDILRRKGFGVEDNFFDLGGHSLVATQLISRIRRALQVDLPLRIVFEHPTIRELAHDIDHARRASAADDSLRLVRRPRPTNAGQEVVFPLSFAEQRLWMLDRLDQNNSVYNLSVGLRLQGRLQVEALQHSLAQIVRRHEVLRARFRFHGDQPEQVIAPEQPVLLPLTDLSDRESPEKQALELVRSESHKPFNLSTGPLWRASLLKLAVDQHVLLINVHHVVFDGWSSGVLLRELVAHYTAFVTGTPSRLPELEIQYTDFAVWQREYLSGERLQRQVNYWKQQLEGAPGYIDLPADHPRPQMQTFHGSHRRLTIPAELSSKLKQLAHKSEATLFMTLLSAFSVLLARYSGQDDVVVGSPIAGRTHAETENLIGFFVNTLPLRAKIAADITFKQLLASIRETTLNAYAYQDLPFEKLVEEIKPERDLSRNPVFQVMFALQNVPRETAELPEVTFSAFRAGGAVNSKFDLSLMAVEQDDSISAVFEYNTDLFEADRIERMQRHWLTLLEGIVANPDCPVADLPLMEAAERQQVLQQWNVSQEYPVESCIHHRFEQQVKRTPANVAVTYEGQTLNYSQLNARANQLARYLIRMGVGPDALVGLCIERSLDMVVAILAILKAGGAYLPLDPRYPKERLAFMVEDAKPQVVLAHSELKESLPQTAGRVFLLDKDWAHVEREESSDVASAIQPENLAYVIYTSGSTGRPKGCQITHANVVRLFDATYDWYRFDQSDVWTMFHSYAFDFSVWELWGALIYGGRLVVVPYLVSRSPEEFYRLLIAEQVTVLNQTPSSFRQLMHAEEKLGNSAQLSLRYVIFGGEALELPSLKLWFERHGDKKPQLVNMYGITETTVHVTYRPLTLDDTAAGSVIGLPIPDLQVYLLDSRKQPVPIGVPGEIYVGGAGVARGYLNRPELNAERFIPDPFSQTTNRYLYKSGDLAVRLPNGDLEYLGRIDQQVKIRGFRVELGEIETSLAKHPSVKQVVVLVREDSPGDKRLVAYIVVNPGKSLDISEARDFLRHSLPDHMVPAALVELDAIPLTSNGKVDRKALPVPELQVSQSIGELLAPRTPTEQTLAAIWSEVLRVRAIGIDQDFFSLGGHSLLATQVISRIQVRLHRDLPLRTLFEHPTVERLAKAVDEAGATAAPKAKIAAANRAAFRTKKT